MIDYARIGANIELNLSAEQCLSFWRNHKGSTDQAMADLAIFAKFLSLAKRYRLDGDIESALRNERNAEYVYERSIKPEHRW